MLSFSTRERPAVLCILTEAPSITHLTFTPQPSRPANTHAYAHTHTHRLRTNLEYFREGEEPHLLSLHNGCSHSRGGLLHNCIKRPQTTLWDVSLRRMRVCPTHSALRNLSTWVINNLWRPLLIHRAGETALDMSFSEDLCSALPFIKRKQVQWRTVRELSVGSDHWHKQSKLTQPSYSTCHSGNTNRSIWGGARSLFKTHIRAPASSSRAPWCKKCVLNTYQSLWQRKCLFEEPTWGKCAVSAECPLSKLAIWIFNHIAPRQMSSEIPYIAIYIILMHALILHYLERKYLGGWKHIRESKKWTEGSGDLSSRHN